MWVGQSLVRLAFDDPPKIRETAIADDDHLVPEIIWRNDQTRRDRSSEENFNALYAQFLGRLPERSRIALKIGAARIGLGGRKAFGIHDLGPELDKVQHRDGTGKVGC